MITKCGESGSDERRRKSFGTPGQGRWDLIAFYKNENGSAVARVFLLDLANGAPASALSELQSLFQVSSDRRMTGSRGEDVAMRAYTLEPGEDPRWEEAKEILNRVGAIAFPPYEELLSQSGSLARLCDFALAAARSHSEGVELNAHLGAIARDGALKRPRV